MGSGAGMVAKGRRRRTFEGWAYDTLGSEWCGNVCPPLSKSKLYLDNGKLICFNNDGHEVWFGTSDHWAYHCTKSEFTRFALWYLWTRIAHDWFGLRTWLWYKLLFRKCASVRSKI